MDDAGRMSESWIDKGGGVRQKREERETHVRLVDVRVYASIS